MRKGTVAYGVVHPAEVSCYFWRSMEKTIRADALGPRRIIADLHKFSSANVSNARNAIVRTFLDKTQAEWLWFIDADMHWNPAELDVLLDYADPVRAPVVGGLCFGVEDGILFPTLYGFRKEDDGRVSTYRLNEYPDNAMFQVGATGAAFLLIHRGVLERIRERAFNAAYPWFQETQISETSPCGEDITFCLRAQQVDAPVYVHTGVEIGHHKSHMLTAGQYREQRAATMEARDGVVHERVRPGPAGPDADPVGGDA